MDVNIESMISMAAYRTEARNCSMTDEDTDGDMLPDCFNKCLYDDFCLLI